MNPSAVKNKTILGADCHLRGELALENDLLVLGEIDGTLHVAGQLDLAAGSRLTGRIDCGTLRLAGHCDATVIARESVEILPGGNLHGLVYSPKLLIQDHSIIDAHLHIGPQAIAQAQENHAALFAAPPSRPAQASPLPRPDSPLDALPTSAPEEIRIQEPVIEHPAPTSSSDLLLPQTTEREPAPVIAQALEQLAAPQAIPAEFNLPPSLPTPEFSPVQTVSQSLRGTLERTRLPRVIKGASLPAVAPAIAPPAASPPAQPPLS